MPNSDRTHRNKSLVDHFVGAGMKDGWNVETERLGGLEIDHQLELGRLLTGKSLGLVPPRILPA
jgi:hypothetical protein